ncbi:MAG: transcriptional regulator [Desulfatitalea sp.]|jgi:transcriptional regulator|nr:transcriptional regulator [Desulfatitalea sp.]
MQTLRQQITTMLEQRPLDLRQLSEALGLREKELLTHLPHVARSVAARKGRWTVVPAECIGCGYTFRDRRRLSPPTRCPRCKASRIHGPWYQVASKS